MPSKQRSVTTLLRFCSTERGSVELRLLLDELVGGPGQYHHCSNTRSKLYLPLAGSSCQIELTVRRKQRPKKPEDRKTIVNIERGPALDVDEWNRLGEKLENALRNGPKKIGRDYSFSSFAVLGSWKGERSSVQILPPPDDAPRPPVLMAEHPFILEFPIQASGSVRVTNHRRIWEHRKLTLLLNVLLAGRTSVQPPRSDHFWAHVPQDDGREEIKLVQQFFYAPLGESVIDQLSPRAEEQLAGIDPEQYYAKVGHDYLEGVRVPADLDDSICLYRALSPTHRAKFDRAAFWCDIASRQRNTSMSASFAALVSAIESLTDRGNSHPVKCTTCNKDIEHEVPGATQRFKDVLQDYASDPSLAKQRDEMYSLRSAILHGSDLTQLDQDLAIVHAVDPGLENELELYDELWRLTRVALRNWLKKFGNCNEIGGSVTSWATPLGSAL
jgi:hypothetical protein